MTADAALPAGDRRPGVPLAVRLLLRVLAMALVPLAAALVLDVGPLSRQWWDTTGYNACCTVATLLVLAAAATRRPGRAAFVVLGLGMSASSAGNWLYQLGGYAGGMVSPSPVDGLWLLMYPLQAAAVLLLLRAEGRRLPPAPGWTA
jgi:hypothetical protein